MAKRSSKSKRLTGDLVEQLKSAINDSGLTRYEIAKRSGVSQAALSRFVSGERGLTLSAAAKVCEVLGLELKQIEGVDLQE